MRRWAVLLLAAGLLALSCGLWVWVWFIGLGGVERMCDTSESRFYSRACWDLYFGQA